MRLSFRVSFQVLALAALTSTLSGCALGTLELSGAAVPTDTHVTAGISGKAFGGQQPVSFSAIHLYAVGATGYGSAATDLTTKLTNTANLYYPGGTTGCNATALAPSAYAADGAGNITFTVPNTMRAGMLAAVADANSGQAGNSLLVTAATAGSITVSAPSSTTAASGADSGTITPVCYAYPTTDANGSFTITGQFSCGVNASSIVYLTATGGNPGLSSASSVNGNLALSTLLQAAPGSSPALTCTQLNNSVSVQMNEMTTAAMGIAMGQYFTPTYGAASTDSFGAPNTAQALKGITNAANTAITLVDTTTGNANSALTMTNGVYSVKVTPEPLKMATIGDILAACVNSQSSNGSLSSPCTTLFSSLQVGATAPSDTLQAAALFGVNPNPSNANSTALWNLVNTTPPFPALGSQPGDWSVGISYADTSCTAGTSTTAGTCIFGVPREVAIDASGNVWIMNQNSTTASSLSEMSPMGAPMLNTNTLGTRQFNGDTARNMVIDTNGNVNLGTSTSSYVLQYNPTTSTSTSLSNGFQPYALVPDSGGNLFVGYASTSLTYSFSEFLSGTIANGSLVEWPAWCNSTQTGYAKCAAGTNTVLPQYGAIDTSGTLWFSNGSNAPSTSIETVSNMSATCITFPCQNGSGNTVTAIYTLIPGGTGGVATLTSPYFLAAAPASVGKVWVSNHGSNALTLMTSATAGTNYANGSSLGVQTPYGIVLDGNSNVWVTNTGSAANAVAEVQGTGTGIGTILSPINTGTAPFNETGFKKNSISSGVGIAVDPSGNVWVGSSANTAGLGITEIVGIAAPTVTPIAATLPLLTSGTNLKP